jgi:hypothetical protein
MPLAGVNQASPNRPQATSQESVCISPHRITNLSW